MEKSERGSEGAREGGSEGGSERGSEGSKRTRGWVRDEGTREGLSLLMGASEGASERGSERGQEGRRGPGRDEINAHLHITPKVPQSAAKTPQNARNAQDGLGRPRNEEARTQCLATTQWPAGARLGRGRVGERACRPTRRPRPPVTSPGHVPGHVPRSRPPVTSPGHGTRDIEQSPPPPPAPGGGAAHVLLHALHTARRRPHIHGGQSP